MIDVPPLPPVKAIEESVDGRRGGRGPLELLYALAVKACTPGVGGAVACLESFGLYTSDRGEGGPSSLEWGVDARHTCVTTHFLFQRLAEFNYML